MNQEPDIENVLKKYNKLPRFPDGRIDYTNAEKAPVLICFVQYQEKILLLRRSSKVGTYKGKWNAIAGFLDEIKPLRIKVLEELAEEIHIQEKDIEKITYGKPYELHDKTINKTWHIHPVLVQLYHKPNIQLDWEHMNYEWIDPQQLSNYDHVFKLEESLKRVLD